MFSSRLLFSRIRIPFLNIILWATLQCTVAAKRILKPFKTEIEIAVLTQSHPNNWKVLFYYALSYTLIFYWKLSFAKYYLLSLFESHYCSVLLCTVYFLISGQNFKSNSASNIILFLANFLALPISERPEISRNGLNRSP